MQNPRQAPFFESTEFDVAVIAASLGGATALRRILFALPADFPAPIVVVQHLSPSPPSPARDLLVRETRLGVEWAHAGMRLRPRQVYLAPPGRHLTITSSGTCELSDGPRVSFARPAADVLFSSAARSFGARVLGVILSGRLQDGAAGAAAIRRAGGVVLAQDPRTCRAVGMPSAAIRSGSVDFVLPPETIACALISLAMVRGTRALFGMERVS